MGAVLCASAVASASTPASVMSFSESGTVHDSEWHCGHDLTLHFDGGQMAALGQMPRERLDAVV